MLAALASWRELRRDRAYAARFVAALAFCALVCAIGLAAYNWRCTGSPWVLTYAGEIRFPGLHIGLFGFSLPKWSTLGELLFGDYRGLLSLSPVLAVVPFGWWVLVRDRTTRALGVVTVSLPVFYVLMNAGAVYWDAGWTYGPRYLSAGRPFWCLGVAVVWTRLPRAVRPALAAVALYGVCLSAMAVATSPQPPGGTVPHPVREFIWPAFEHGYVALNPTGFTDNRVLEPQDLIPPRMPPAAWNVGQRWFHLEGLASLTPLLAWWAAAGAAWILLARRTARAAANPSGPARAGPLHSSASIS